MLLRSEMNYKSAPNEALRHLGRPNSIVGVTALVWVRIPHTGAKDDLHTSGCKEFRASDRGFLHGLVRATIIAGKGFRV